MKSSNIPPHTDELQVELPVEHVLLLRLNRPKSLNAMTPGMDKDLTTLLDWFDAEPSLWVVIVTGTGRAFCAGADLKEWNRTQQARTVNDQERAASGNEHGKGFASLSLRQCTKPIVAAVNGLAHGGGMELILNCDLVVASEDAKFALPEVKRGVMAIMGGIPRLSRIAGHQLASEMLILGEPINAWDAQKRFGFVNKVVPAPSVLPTAVKMAKTIIGNSPDAVQSTKQALLEAQNNGVHEARLTNVWSSQTKRAYEGANIKEGLKAFSEKRKPVWKDPSKL